MEESSHSVQVRRTAPARPDPFPLKPGATVALVAPAGPVSASGADRAEGLLAAAGFRVERYPPSACATKDQDSPSYLAASDDFRLAEFQWAWSTPEIEAVICLRGGYGTQRIVDRIDWSAGRKILAGSSDITALHLSAWGSVRLPTLYAPGIGSDGRKLPKRSREALLSNLRGVWCREISINRSEPAAALRRGRGRVEGVLLGGNLTLLASSVGTPSMPPCKDSIMFVEEINESPYRVDRLLTQLGRAGVLDACAAVVIGQLGRADSMEHEVVQVVADRLDRWNVNYLGGVSCGHRGEFEILRLGRRVVLDFEQHSITYLDEDRA